MSDLINSEIDRISGTEIPTHADIQHIEELVAQTVLTSYDLERYSKKLNALRNKTKPKRGKLKLSVSSAAPYNEPSKLFEPEQNDAMVADSESYSNKKIAVDGRSVNISSATHAIRKLTGQAISASIKDSNYIIVELTTSGALYLENVHDGIIIAKTQQFRALNCNNLRLYANIKPAIERDLGLLMSYRLT
ncbi:hypothetical protein CANCADRAFT_1749 [Tortispora caseinolytica NRRL Y-17796]|uniref:C-CAP/cofactor C-like domain-containing protein n=1 Tax=Tortispora caseinolytica NRRL Y-17796 TaxID=767744 RepID=A0A1E4TE29_9ASCO|nr:hypothetical protein CANCADRAFT_1749 [Tortispora caseinolytica NRRL Y-17796]